VSIYHVFANRSNVGDWLSARGIQALLAPLRVTELLCDDPFVPDTLAALNGAGPADFIVIGGGGLFMDYFEPFWRGFEPISRRVPFAIWGVGCCHMKRERSELPRALLAPIVRRGRLCAVRDDLTRDYLTADLPSPVPCPTLAAVEPVALGRGVLHVDAFDNVGETVYAEMNRVGADFATHTERPFRAINNLIRGGDERELANTLAHYAAADVILAGRLHACIIGLGMGRKVLAVSGDHKLESFMGAAGLSDWVLGLDDIGALPNRLAQLAEQGAPQSFLTRARQDNRRVAAQLRAFMRAG
jgi:polysaccharide pyruvyl transferase WcaK-like protein